MRTLREHLDVLLADDGDDEVQHEHKRDKIIDEQIQRHQAVAAPLVSGEVAAAERFAKQDLPQTLEQEAWS